MPVMVNTCLASGPLSIDNIEIAAGIDLSHIRADLEIENTDKINLQNLYAETL